MHEITSYKIQLEQQLQTKDIMKIHQFSIQKDVNIYLYRKESMAEAKNLPKLLSFFFIGSHHEILLIIEGKNASQAYSQLTSILSQTEFQTA